MLKPAHPRRPPQLEGPPYVVPTHNRGINEIACRGEWCQAGLMIDGEAWDGEGWQGNRTSGSGRRLTEPVASARLTWMRPTYELLRTRSSGARLWTEWWTARG